MGWLAKLKTTLEWMRLAKFVADIAIAIASWKAVRKLLTYVPQISEDWASVLALFAAALILFALIWCQQRASQAGQKQGIQSATNALTTSKANFDATEFLKRAYNSQLREEVESNVRIAATQTQPNDREGFYVKLIAVGTLNYIYDLIWAYIYRSQILLLLELNRRMLSIAEVKAYYDKAASDNPTAYEKYSFDQWLSFLKSQILLIHHPSDMLEITVRGKDFLKYLVHWGRYADDKKL